jgi:hypothetical protein
MLHKWFGHRPPCHVCQPRSVPKPGSAFSLQEWKGRKELNLLARRNHPSHRTQNIVEISYYCSLHRTRSQFSTFNLKTQKDTFSKDFGITTPKTTHNMQNIMKHIRIPSAESQLSVVLTSWKYGWCVMAKLFGHKPDTAGTDAPLDIQIHCWLYGHLILYSFDWLAAFHLEMLQAIPFIAVIGTAIDQKPTGEDETHRVGCRTAVWRDRRNNHIIISKKQVKYYDESTW